MPPMAQYLTPRSLEGMITHNSHMTPYHSYSPPTPQLHPPMKEALIGLSSSVGQQPQHLFIQAPIEDVDPITACTQQFSHGLHLMDESEAGGVLVIDESIPPTASWYSSDSSHQLLHRSQSGQTADYHHRHQPHQHHTHTSSPKYPSEVVSTIPSPVSSSTSCLQSSVADGEFQTTNSFGSNSFGSSDSFSNGNYFHYGFPSSTSSSTTTHSPASSTPGAPKAANQHFSPLLPPALDCAFDMGVFPRPYDSPSSSGFIYEANLNPNQPPVEPLTGHTTEDDASLISSPSRRPNKSRRLSLPVQAALAAANGHMFNLSPAARANHEDHSSSVPFHSLSDSDLSDDRPAFLRRGRCGFGLDPTDEEDQGQSPNNNNLQQVDEVLSDSDTAFSHAPSFSGSIPDSCSTTDPSRPQSVSLNSNCSDLSSVISMMSMDDSRGRSNSATTATTNVTVRSRGGPLYASFLNIMRAATSAPPTPVAAHNSSSFFGPNSATTHQQSGVRLKTRSIRTLSPEERRSQSNRSSAGTRNNSGSRLDLPLTTTFVPQLSPILMSYPNHQAGDGGSDDGDDATTPNCSRSQCISPCPSSHSLLSTTSSSSCLSTRHTKRRRSEENDQAMAIIAAQLQQCQQHQQHAADSPKENNSMDEVDDSQEQQPQRLSISITHIDDSDAHIITECHNYTPLTTPTNRQTMFVMQPPTPTSSTTTVSITSSSSDDSLSTSAQMDPHSLGASFARRRGTMVTASAWQLLQQQIAHYRTTPNQP